MVVAAANEQRITSYVACARVSTLNGGECYSGGGGGECVDLIWRVSPKNAVGDDGGEGRIVECNSAATSARIVSYRTVCDGRGRVVAMNPAATSGIIFLYRTVCNGGRGVE